MQASAKGLAQFLASNSVKEAAPCFGTINSTHEPAFCELRQHAHFENFLDDQWHAEHDGRTHSLERRKQRRSGWRLFEIVHRRSLHDRQDEPERVFIGVRERKNGKENILSHDRLHGLHLAGIVRNVFVRQHDALRFSCGSGGIDNRSEVLFLHIRWRKGSDLRSPKRCTPILPNNHQIIENDPMPQRGNLERFDMPKELFRNKQHVATGMLKEGGDFLFVKIGQQRYNHRSHAHNGKIGNTPVRHVAAENRDTVAGTHSMLTESGANACHLLSEFAVSHW